MDVKYCSIGEMRNTIERCAKKKSNATGAYGTLSVKAWLFEGLYAE